MSRYLLMRKMQKSKEQQIDDSDSNDLVDDYEPFNGDFVSEQRINVRILDECECSENVANNPDEVEHVSDLFAGNDLAENLDAADVFTGINGNAGTYFFCAIMLLHLICLIEILLHLIC